MAAERDVLRAAATDAQAVADAAEAALRAARDELAAERATRARHEDVRTNGAGECSSLPRLCASSGEPWLCSWPKAAPSAAARPLRPHPHRRSHA
jgi:hypothetical protein